MAEYRVPEFQVKLSSEASQVLPGGKVKVTINSSFFFGGAVSNAMVSWQVFEDYYRFDYKGNGRYSFMDYDEDGRVGDFGPIFGS